MRMSLTAVAMMVATLVAGAPAADVSAHQIERADLKIVHPWTKEPPAGATHVDVRMTIHNGGGSSDRLVAVSSPLARSALITATGGVITIPAGGRVTLSTAGDHIRLDGLTEALTGYETFPLWLTFARAGRVEVEVMVEEADHADDNPATKAPSNAPSDPHQAHGDRK